MPQGKYELEHDNIEVRKQAYEMKAEKEKAELKFKLFYNRIDIEYYERRIMELKERAWFFLIFGASIGTLVTIILVIIHNNR